MKYTLRDISFAAFLTAVLYVQQVALSALPNIQLCTVLLIWYTLHFSRLLPLVLPGFILLEGITYGFGIWWFSYLYVWAILVLIVYPLRKKELSPVLLAAIGGGFGLAFGFLCSLPYFAMGGVSLGFSYWISGIPFDIAHCVGNAVATLLLWKPLEFVAQRLRPYLDAKKH